MTHTFIGKSGKWKIPKGTPVTVLKYFPKRKCLIEWAGGQDITMVSLLRRLKGGCFEFI